MSTVRPSHRLTRRLRHPLSFPGLILLGLCALLPFGAGSSESPPSRRSPARAPCSDHNPMRNAYFGDLHVHTAFSLDASTQGTRHTPRDAYRFAKGEPLAIQPYDLQGNPTRRLQLTRPLDFAAVTDHAELFGELTLCQSPGTPGYDAVICQVYRRWPRGAFFLMNNRASSVRSPQRYTLCGPDGQRCAETARTPWNLTREAAEEAYDRTAACTFTSFIGYEWTGTPGTNNLHRNVLFRGEAVPDVPISRFEAVTPEALRRQLSEACLEGLPGCDALIIPHNANLSGGLMFTGLDDEGGPLTAAEARRRRELEPLVEVLQHKGDSECRVGAGVQDELCGFEKLPYDNFLGKFLPPMARSPGPSNFTREALKQGLLIEARLGENPYKFGHIASTDTHLATPGAVGERGYPGHGGAGRPASSGPPGLPDDVEYNPGGLAVLWAEENSREALFAAMRRREAYGTSGPRMTVRFFGGWDYPTDLCDAPDFAARGYAGGVPMGGDLPPMPGVPAEAASSLEPDAAGVTGPAPTLAIQAMKDPGTVNGPGTPLQRIQVVKGWIEGGQPREQVYDVAGDPHNGAEVDPRTCETRGRGADRLCTVWRDPDFDPGEHAFYYVRVLENPTCRWTTWQCNARGVDCARPDTVGPGMEPCCDARYPKSIQERAWTSPIWYSPAGREGRGG